MRKTQLTPEEIGSLSGKLAMLLHAGLPTAEVLHLAAEDEPEGPLHTLLGELTGKTEEGASLSAALRSADCVPTYVSGLLEVGERSGRTEEALQALARYYEGRAAMDRHLRSALLYPAILLMLLLTVIVLLLTRVLPIFDTVYGQLGGRLTGVAGGLLQLGQVLERIMPLLCVLLAAAAVLIVLFSEVPAVRARMLKWWQRRRGDRGTAGKLNRSRFAQAFSMGLDSGLPVEEALELAASLLDEAPAMQHRCESCLAELEHGKPLAQALGEAELLPRGDCRLLVAGLRSGSGDRAMAQVVRRLTEDGEASLEERVSQVEPALVLAGSLLVGLILLAVMLPLMNILSAIG